MRDKTDRSEINRQAGPPAKPRARVAVAYARSFAAGLIQDAKGGFLKEGTCLTDEEEKLVVQELERIQSRIEATINHDLVAKATGAAN